MRPATGLDPPCTGAIHTLPNDRKGCKPPPPHGKPRTQHTHFPGPIELIIRWDLSRP
jgi:hypothetical protein